MLTSPAFLIGALSTLAVAAQPPGETRADLDEVWAAIRARAPALRAAGLSREAAAIARTRVGRAWLPRVAAQARVFGTDDPAGTFFALLGEREVEARDFAPDELNHPDTRLFAQAALRLDWLAYDGGARASEAAVARDTELARALELVATREELYVQTVRLFGAASVFEDALLAATALNEEAAKLLAGYRIGTPESPLAYAGKLGLEALQARLNAFAMTQETGLASTREALALLAGRAGALHPAKVDVLEFVQRRLAVDPVETPSARVRSLEAAASAAASREGAEGARLRPRAGLFAEVPLVAGARGVGLAWTAGAQLGWELLSARDWEAAKEARLEGASARARAEAEGERERLAGVRARRELGALVRTIPMLANNVLLLTRQTGLAQQLFENGALQAMQVADALARRADAVEALARTRLACLDAAAALALATGPVAPGDPDGR